jgi:phosphoenolpyruvate-protein kinase (PTS system EI component)
MQGKEISVRGIAVSPGIAIGRAYVQQPREILAPNFLVAREKVEEEIERLHRGLERTRDVRRIRLQSRHRTHHRVFRHNW